jgi:hypothetical protein
MTSLSLTAHSTIDGLALTLSFVSCIVSRCLIMTLAVLLTYVYAMPYQCVHAWRYNTLHQGTYGSTSGLRALNECTDCATGAYCPLASTISNVCPPGTYCGTRAANYTVCPGECTNCITAQYNSHWHRLYLT